MKHKTRTKVWSILLSLALLLGLMPGMSLTALATSPAGAYSAYDVTTDANKTKTGDDLAALQVTFNGMPWYIIEDNSTEADAGTVTLFAKECVGVSVFSTNGDKFYSRSTVKAYLDGLTAEGGSFAGVADAIVGTDLTDMSVTGAKLYLLSTDEANAVPADARKCSKPGEAVRNYWWLRSYSSVSSSAVFVDGGDGAVHTDGSDVGSAFGVRPALRLDLSKVTFDATSKTFTVGGTSAVSFSQVTGAATLTADSIGICTEAEAKAWIKANFDDIKSAIAAASNKSADFGFKGADFKPGDNIHYLEVTSSTAASGVDSLRVYNVSVDGFNARNSMRILFVCDPSSSAETYPLWVGGTRVTSANAANITGEATATASYDADTNTLSLNGATITTGYTDAGIFYTGSDAALKIELSSDNKVNEDASLKNGILCTGQKGVEISGTGSLTVNGSNGIAGNAISTNGGDIVINGGTINANSEGDSGFYSSKNVTITGGTVIASGRTGIGVSTSNGGFITVGENAVVTATGTNKALNGPVKNAIAGNGWTDTAGTEGEAVIAVNTDGQTMTYKKVQFPMAHVAKVTTAGGEVTYYDDLPTAVAAWNDIDGSTLTPQVDFNVPEGVAFAVKKGNILDVPKDVTLGGAGSVANNGTINISGTVDTTKGTITTAGTVNVKETGTLLIAAMPQAGELTITAGGIIKVPAGGSAMIAVVGNEGTSPEEAATRLLAGTLSFSMTADDGFTDILDEDGELIVYAWDMDTSAPGATGQKKLINNGRIYVPEDCTMSLGENTTMTGPDGTVIIDGTVDASKGSIEDVGTVRVTEFGTLLIQAVPKTGELTVEADGVVAVPTPYKTIVIVGSMDTLDAGIILESGTMTFLMEKSGNTYTVEEGSKLRVNRWDLDSSFHGAGIDKTLVNEGAILVQPDGALTLGENTTMTGANGTVTISGTVDASRGVIEDAGVICVEETGTLRTGPMPQTGEVTVKAGGLIEVPVSPEAKIVVVGNQTTPNAGIVLKEGEITFLMEADSNTYTVGENSTLDVNSWDLGSQFHGGTGQKTLVNDGTINVPGGLTIDANSTLENNGTVSLTAKTAKVTVYEETKGALVVGNSDGGVHSGQGAEAKTVYSWPKDPATDLPVPADIPDNDTTAVESTGDLVIDAVAGQEYVLVTGDAQPDWTKPLAVTDGKITIPDADLKGGARYAVYTRVAETDNTLASEAASTPFVTTVSESGWYGDGDPELIGATITTEFASVDDLTYQWYQCDGEDGTGASPISGATGTEFTVPADLEGKYLFAAAAIDGIEVGRIDPRGPVSYGTVTFDSKGGSPVESKTGLTCGMKLEQPESTRSGWYLEGWYLDEAYKDAWSFDVNVVSWAETTLYAKWSEVPAFGIQGVVYASDEETTLQGVEINLMQGDATFGTAITDEEGRFSFSAVAGDYNVVAYDETSDVIKTELVKLTQEGQTLTIIMPGAGRNSELDNTYAGDFAATAGGLDQIAANTPANADEDVTISLNVVSDSNVRRAYTDFPEKQAAYNASKDAIQADPAAAGKTMDYLDMTLEKCVATGDGCEKTDIGAENTQLLTIIIPFDANNKSNITVFRASGAMQQDPGEGQEGYKVENGTITIYTTNPTTYGIGYNTVSNSGSNGGGGGGGGGGGAASNPVKTPASGATAGGTVKTSTANAKAGDKVTVTPQPDEGYVTAGVTVTDAKGNNVPVTKNADGTYSFTMPATAVTVTPTFEKAEPDSTDNPDNTGGDVSSRFKDVPKDAWYHDAVQWAVDKGIMNGVSEDAFAPNDTATRAMVVTMLWRLAGEPAASEPSGFSDVSSGAWYAGAVAWAAETAAVNGVTADTFSPNTPVTREQLAAILYRYAQAQGKGFTGAWMFPLDYSDAADVSEWADEAMHWMTMNGIITGMGDGTLAPKDNATRAQIAAMFMRFVETMEK